MVDHEYIEQILQFRAARDLRMKTNPQSWFALVGLFPLDEGENRFGSGPDNRMILASMSLAHAGSFRLINGKVTLEADPSAKIRVNGGIPELRPLRTDHDPDPDLIEVGSMTMRILLRNEKHYLRVWDGESEKVKAFQALHYYPVDGSYRIPAHFHWYEPPRTIKTQDAIGGQHDTLLVGVAHFWVSGVECSLVAEGDEEEILFSFVDETRRDTTYPGGRFLSMERPKQEEITLDFNQALNWPCAYTDYATCPIPPSENHLKVRIEAGEQRYRQP